MCCILSVVGAGGYYGYNYCRKLRGYLWNSTYFWSSCIYSFNTSMCIMFWQTKNFILTGRYIPSWKGSILRSKVLSPSHFCLVWTRLPLLYFEIKCCCWPNYPCVSWHTFRYKPFQVFSIICFQDSWLLPECYLWHSLRHGRCPHEEYK